MHTTNLSDILAEAQKAVEEAGQAIDARDVRRVLPALAHPDSAVRDRAAYLLGNRWKDKRVVKPLLAMLRDKHEDAQVRSTVADTLAHHRRRRMIVPTLIEMSTDPNPVVRFWCVFALGSQMQFQRNPPPAVIRALESRLDDAAEVPGWWQVRLEAIAMLAGVKKSSASKLLSEILRQVFADPLTHSEKWKWAEHYVDHVEYGQLNELESASRKLVQAGFDPVTFGSGITPGSYSWPRPTQP